MRNLLSYEKYKILHNPLTYVILAVGCVVSLLFTSSDYLSDPIVPGTPDNLTGIFMNEVADVGIAVLILVGCYAMYLFGADMKNRCINYELISGNNREIIFLSHYVVMFLLCGTIITISLLIGSCKFGGINLISQICKNGAYYFRIILLMYVISYAIISVCITFVILFQDTARTVLVSFVVLFLACYMMAAVANTNIAEGHMESAYEITKGWLLLYPPYLWRWVLNPNLKVKQFGAALAVGTVWCGITFFVNRYLFCNREFK